MDTQILYSIIKDLKEGRVPAMNVADFTCFSEKASEGKEFLGEKPYRYSQRVSMKVISPHLSGLSDQ